MENKRRILNRNKTIATGLMVGAALLFIVARSRHQLGAWERIGAFADWFAVVALFRHPLGLPIPHTAIIKNKKEAIAGNLADFIRDKNRHQAVLDDILCRGAALSAWCCMESVSFCEPASVTATGTGFFVSDDLPPDYSKRSASMGLSRAALRAG